MLHGIDLDVPAGTTVALVGHTGAGKSTIAKLLARFYEPTHGRLTIDGVDLNDVTQASLRRQLGVVPQEGFLFAGTVADNIAFGKPDATADEIVGPHRPSAHTTSSLRLEDGYETQLGERGTRLSLGQRQLVAFARALLADPRILILDEATSSVDIGTERRIEAALDVLLADRTAFIIAHRLSTIRDADLIVVLEHGRVVEQGSHEELLAARGLYTVALRRLGVRRRIGLHHREPLHDRRMVLEEDVVPRRRIGLAQRRRHERLEELLAPTGSRVARSADQSASASMCRVITFWSGRATRLSATRRRRESGTASALRMPPLLRVPRARGTRPGTRRGRTSRPGSRCGCARDGRARVRGRRGPRGR